MSRKALLFRSSMKENKDETTQVILERNRQGAKRHSCTKPMKLETAVKRATTLHRKKGL